MPNYVIPLYSGIGNIIQSIPFANEMKKRYGTVTAIPFYSDYIESSSIVKDVFDCIYMSQAQIPNGFQLAKIPERTSYPEYKAWFIQNKEDPPEKFSTENVGFEMLLDAHQTVIWPECKPNWPCKRWPYFPELTAQFEDPGVIGLEPDANFKNATDYRGKLSLLQTGGILKNADIFIGNEGGMAHYAAALGIKTYIIMGCTDPVKNLPPNNAIPISLELPCQPCQFKNMMVTTTTAIGCHEKKCLNDLTVEKVLNDISHHDSMR